VTVPDDARDAGAPRPAQDADAPAEAPAARGPRARGRHRRVVRPGTEQGPVSGASDDERGSSSGDLGVDQGNGGGNDTRLREDVPPHWEPSRRF